MSTSKRSVLITGCSDGGMGSALAIAAASAGLKVYATARKVEKMSALASHNNITCLPLDITSTTSIQSCLSQIPSLDALVNNAGVSHSMPVSDLSLQMAKSLFETNVWSQIAVTQAFLPLLLASKGLILNQTSVVSVLPGPFQSAYNASKAALMMFSESMRFELEPFGVKVIELKTGGVLTKIVENQKTVTTTTLPQDSIYKPVQDIVEPILQYEHMEGKGVSPEQWAAEVVRDVFLVKNPPNVVWRGAQARMARVAAVMPSSLTDGMMRKLVGLDKIAQRIG